MDSSQRGETRSSPAGRNYAGVRITRPPDKTSRLAALGNTSSTERSGEGSGQGYDDERDASDQARILTGAALFGVIISVLVHELGHWFAGLVVTGKTPDFLFIAVRQNVEDLSGVAGIITWGIGPVVHVALALGLIAYGVPRSRTHPRIFVMGGAVSIVAAVVIAIAWIVASFADPESWSNDLPKVAALLGSPEHLWLYLLSAGFLAILLSGLFVWFRAARSTGRQSIYVVPAVTGAIQGAVVLVIASFLLSLVDL